MPGRVGTFLAGGGELGTLMRGHSWRETALGHERHWPQPLRTLVQVMLGSRQPMFIAWGEDRVLLYNDAYVPLLGARHPEALGRPFFAVWPEIRKEVGALMDQVFAGQPVHMDELQLILYRNGYPEETHFAFSYTPVPGNEGGIAGLFCVCTETTRQILAEREAARATERQRRMLQELPGFIAVLREPGHVFEYVNDAYVTIAGPRDFIGRSVRQVFPELESQGFYQLLDRVQATGEPFSARAQPLRLAGEDAERFIDFRYQPILDDAGAVTGIFVGGYDVTEAIRTAGALRALSADVENQVTARAHERSRTWLVSTDLLGISNPDGYFKRTNPAWQAVLGWSEAEIAMLHVVDFVHPDDLEASLAALEHLKQGHPILGFENRCRTKDGTYRWLAWVAVPEDGVYYCSARDVTRARELAAERERLEEQLRQSQKMEAVGQLTGGLAHDFNNLLTGIIGSLELLQTRIAQGRVKEADRYVSAAQGAAKRAAALTHRLLAFSRRQTLDPRPTDLNGLVGGMEELIRRTVGPQIDVQARLTAGLWPCLVDHGQLENALLNLCINANDAMPEGGRITIETGNRWLGAQVAQDRELQPGPYVSLCVSDTGIGMAADVIAKAFDPFFTTKPIGKGTGLGLSMIYGFARQSGGQVRVESQVGRGTTVCLVLPRHLGACDAPTPSEPAAAPTAQQGEAVLVVDDEPAVRMLVTEVLQDLGYTAIEAADGTAALGVLQSDVRLDLLVTDIGLPGGINGRQVAQAARAIRPHLSVLFITGYAESTVIDPDRPAPGMHVMTKPFAMEALATRIRELIARSAPS